MIFEGKVVYHELFAGFIHESAQDNGTAIVPSVPIGPMQARGLGVFRLRLRGFGLRGVGALED